MSTFLVPVVSVRAIEEIPGADAICLAVIGDYRSVVLKGQYEKGDLAVYLPEASILPANIIEELGLVGRLAGADKNRVKAIKLLGVVSQGILYDAVPDGVAVGTDMAAALGIYKWEPPIPVAMAGEVANMFGHTVKYDIENFKLYPDILQPGEMVEMTEKAHGTFCAIAVVDGINHEEMFDGNGLVYSKGLGAQGLVFKDVESNTNNLYVRAAKSNAIHSKIRECFPGSTVHVFGEVYGQGVQDLSYGLKEQAFAVFDIWKDGKYLDRKDLADAVTKLGLNRVPILYSGPFDQAVMQEWTDGKTILGNGSNIREGVVVTPMEERRNNQIGRVILKSVSADYLLRKGNNVTEYS